MKIISAFISLFILILVLCFALPNQLQVSIGMWPFVGQWQVPLYLVGLLPLACGLVFGGLLGWLGGVPHRLRARRLKRELDELNEQISELQKSAIVQSAQIVHKRPFWKRKV